MKRDEIISMAYKYLNDVPDIRKRIKLIDVVLKKNTYNINTINKLKQERHSLQCKLSKIIKTVCELNDEDQRIICYVYFEKLNYTEIGKRVGHCARTISRRSQKLLLYVGRSLFGMEDEFWVEICGAE